MAVLYVCSILQSLNERLPIATTPTAIAISSSFYKVGARAYVVFLSGIIAQRESLAGRRGRHSYARLQAIAAERW